MKMMVGELFSDLNTPINSPDLFSGVGNSRNPPNVNLLKAPQVFSSQTISVAKLKPEKKVHTIDFNFLE